MNVQKIAAADAIARLSEFGAIIDARSPAEWALDHLPGALNWPSLNDEERVLVGTLYAQVSPFEAQKRGAALVAANIARHIEREVMDKPRNWQPINRPSSRRTSPINVSQLLESSQNTSTSDQKVVGALRSRHQVQIWASVP